MTGSRQCVFCGEPRKLTRGHIFGDQLVEALPPGKGDTPFLGKVYQMDDTGKQWVQLEHREMPSSHEMPVRVICDPCNRVWMGGHETAVKAVLLNAQRRTTYRISRVQQETLASWIYIISILSQYTSRAILPVTPSEVRHSFRQTDRIPAGTHMWLGRSAELPWMQFGICHRLDPGLAEEHHQGLRRFIYVVIFGPFAVILLEGRHLDSITTSISSLPLLFSASGHPARRDQSSGHRLLRAWPPSTWTAFGGWLPSD